MSDTPDPLEAALAEILDAESAGRSVERAAWLARFPDLATELAEFLDAHARLNAVAASNWVPIAARSADGANESTSSGGRPCSAAKPVASASA